MGFPTERLRRLRTCEAVRRLVRETDLCPSHWILPVFLKEGQDQVHPIASMPGQMQFSVDRLDSLLERAHAAGIGGVLLFGIPSRKDAFGSSAWDDEGVVQRGIRKIRETSPGLVVMTDVCLCEYTDHGHCGLVAEGKILNDPTLELLAKMAVSHARAGAHMVAPSDMMDGRVAAIRKSLDAEGAADVAILSYAVKYASSFYGPFREAAQSAPSFGDRTTHQMDPGNRREALREVRLDLEEGADIVMVKPALAYLDVISKLRDTVSKPIAAYSVSGEYSMVKAASARGWMDERRAGLEILTAIRRAGANIVVTYWALEAAQWIAEGSRGEG